MAILLLWFGQALYLPAQRQIDGDVIDFLRRVFEVERMYAVGMLENVLLGSAKDSPRHKSPPPRPGNPAGDFQGELCYQWLRGTFPVRLVRQFHLSRDGNVLLN